ncbi:Hypp1364 [Branchiostoma lanceolatum]|uniref:Hypp1364 protein n=1 Tax=Branchiostoma lanceolatum TaxID=7740 RepID=A0A8J9ZH00_BRALA|nr:Hypp1364 [Branchiostoma lanceolatum]
MNPNPAPDNLDVVPTEIGGVELTGFRILDTEYVSLPEIRNKLGGVQRVWCRWTVRAALMNFSGRPDSIPYTEIHGIDDNRIFLPLRL